MDHTSLSNISQEEFEKNVEVAIQSLPPPSPTIERTAPTRTNTEIQKELPEAVTPSAAPASGEESATALQLPTPASFADDTRRFFQRTSSLAQQTISKPLNAISKIFEAFDEDQKKQEQQQQQQQGGDRFRTPVAQVGSFSGAIQTSAPQTPYKARIRPVNSTPSTPGIRTPEYHSGSIAQPNFLMGGGNTPIRNVTPDPIMAEVGAIDYAHRRAAQDTIQQMFPGVERDVLDMVLDANGGDLGRTIDSLLEISAS